MMAEVSPPAPFEGPSSSAFQPGAGEKISLPTGQILSAITGEVPTGAPSGTFLAYLNGNPILLQSHLSFLIGEKILFQINREDGKEVAHLVARSGAQGEFLEPLEPGVVRLAPGQVISNSIRTLLATTKIPLAGQILPFQRRGEVPVRLAGQELTFQMRINSRPGNQFFIGPREVGGAFGLKVIAHGGPQAKSAPPGPQGRLEILQVRIGGFPVPLSESSLQPGNILTGRIIRIAPLSVPSSLDPGPGGRASSLDSGRGGREGGGHLTASPQGAGESLRSESFSQGISPVRTAVLRFPGLDIEVNLPHQAEGDFSPGDPVRVLVRGVEPHLDLELLPPGGAESVKAAKWVRIGGAGDRSFGHQLTDLRQTLDATKELWATGRMAGPSGDLRDALEAVVLRGEGLTAENIREAVERSGVFPSLVSFEKGPAERGDLRASLQRFLIALREEGLGENQAFQDLAGGAERAVAAVEFLQTANGLRHLVDQGTFFQLPYSFGSERGTLDMVFRRGEEEGGEEAAKRENYSAVFLLELEGLGRLRIDASLSKNSVNVRFTTSTEEVGSFIGEEIPHLREEIESQNFKVDGITWMLARVQPESLLPSDLGEELSEETSYINLRI